jgi:hypothetical protein
MRYSTAEDKPYHMKAALYTFLLMSILLSCKKAAELHYDHPASVHFNLAPENIDSIIYTFAYKPSLAQDTIWLPVQISGFREHQNRSYSAYIDQDSSTAKPGEHFEPLKDSYTLPSDSGTTRLPIIIYNTSALGNGAVSLVVKLKATNELGIEIPVSADGIRLLKSKIVFSATLAKPNWWNMWMGSYYSQTKHQLFLIVTGVTTLTTEGIDAPRNLYIANLLTTMLNDPFKWVADNPGKGYVLERINDDTYYFYSTENPGKKMLLKKNASVGKYYFIDENDEEVS